MLGLAAALQAGGVPFVLATVVWSHGPTSGKQASKALVHPDGTVEGWLGGACAEPTLVQEARRALLDARPRLLFLGVEEDLPPGLRDDVTTVAMACESEGAMAVFMEPVLPPPRVMVVGRSPAVDTLARLVQTIGWRATVVDDGGTPDVHSGVERVATSLDALGEADGTSFIVVATQGHYDEVALEMALTTGAGYVGLVASRKRSDSVLEFLRRAVDEFTQTIVMVTHDANAASYADRVIFLADGRVVDQMDSPTADRVLDRIKRLDS